MTVPFLPYGHQHITESDIRAVTDTLKSDFLTQGPKIRELEEKICEITGAPYCVAVSNGTAALHLAVAALELSTGKSGITSPMTFAASANCLIYCGLMPEFCDIDPDTGNISVKKLSEIVSEKTGVIVAVDYAGQPAEMEKISAIAESRGIFVIEDAAHATGSKYADGSMVGSCRFSDLTTFSFHPVKTVTTGEGGAITTKHPDLYKKLLMLRSHGITKDPGAFDFKTDDPWYQEMQMLGFNYRLSDILAALGISQLSRLSQYVKRRREIVQYYNTAFSSHPLLTVPHENPGVYSSFHLYALRINFEKAGKSRAEVMKKLWSAGIGTQVHYIPVYHHPYYRNTYGYSPGLCPEAENFYAQELSLPLYFGLDDCDLSRVVHGVLDALS